MDEITEVAARARRYAHLHPVGKSFLTVAAQMPEVTRPYQFRVTNTYHVMLTVFTERLRDCPFPPPFWHAQFIVVEKVGELEFGAEERAMVATKDWTREEVSATMEILSEVFGPLLKRASQDVHVHDGLWARHFFTPVVEEDEKATAN